MTRSRNCPVCGEGGDAARVFMEENIDPSRISAYSYASRKTPEFMCHRLVQCPTCDLVYVDRPPEDSELAEAYHIAEYDSTEEANDAADTYIRAMSPLLDGLVSRGTALEIGTGTGVLLDHLKQRGFVDVVGVEPSSAAIAAAPPARRAWIREGVFEARDFEPASLDLVCCFMTLEHVADPGKLAREVFGLLKPGGAFVSVVHDYRSLVNRTLGRRSPIIDIEHMQLFSDRSIRELYSRSGYSGISARPFANRYGLNYWLRLTPLPSGLKSAAASILRTFRLDKTKVAVNVGNMVSWGVRPT